MEGLPNVKFMHPLRIKGLTNNIYMVDPNGLFDETWRRTSPGQVNHIKPKVVEANIERLTGDEPVFLPVPHIMLDHDNKTGSAITFIDGIHRTQAFKQLNQPIPVLVNTDVRGDLSQHPVLGKIFKPLPEHIKRQIEQHNEDPPGDAGPSHIETKIAWARENEKKLRRYYRSKFGEFVGDKFYEYYLQHGRVPARYMIEYWQEEARRQGKSTEPDQAAIEEIRREWVFASYERITGSPEAAQLCYDRWINGGGMALDRKVVESLTWQATGKMPDSKRMAAAVLETEPQQERPDLYQATPPNIAHGITAEPTQPAMAKAANVDVPAPAVAEQAVGLAPTHEREVGMAHEPKLDAPKGVAAVEPAPEAVPGVRLGSRVIEASRLLERLKEAPRGWRLRDREPGSGGRGGPGL